MSMVSVSQAAAAPAADQTVYVVRAGDTVGRIAARYGVSVSALTNANGITNPNRIYVGQRLVIPGASGSPSTPAPGPAPVTGGIYVVQPGDTLSKIAARHRTTVAALMAANGVTNPDRVRVGQRLIIPGAGGSPSTPAPGLAPVTGGIYIVQPGDTLSKIAARHRTTVAALMAANGITNPDRIWVGQRLRIGGSGAAPVSGPVGERWIDINLSTQRLTAYQGNTPVFTALISGGLPRTPTVVGRFKIYTKLASTRMRGPGYDLPNVPYTMYFYKGYAIHGTYWHNNFGRPMSHGCVNMRTQDAAWLFNWASVGTTVVTHW